MHSESHNHQATMESGAYLQGHIWMKDAVAAVAWAI